MIAVEEERLELHAYCQRLKDLLQALFFQRKYGYLAEIGSDSYPCLLQVDFILVPSKEDLSNLTVFQIAFEATARAELRRFRATFAHKTPTPSTRVHVFCHLEADFARAVKLDFYDFLPLPLLIGHVKSLQLHRIPALPLLLKTRHSRILHLLFCHARATFYSLLSAARVV